MSKKCANMRSIFDSFAENAEIVDWVAEQSGFEPPALIAFSSLNCPHDSRDILN
jgi:hypothetical protein